MNADELNLLIKEHFAYIQDSVSVVATDKDQVVVKMQPEASHLRPGNTVSGPALMALADITGYFSILSMLGPELMAVTVNLNINFLHRPRADKPLYGYGTLLKTGKRLVICDINIKQRIEKENEITVAHSTSTYSLPPLKHT